MSSPVAVLRFFKAAEQSVKDFCEFFPGLGGVELLCDGFASAQVRRVGDAASVAVGVCGLIVAFADRAGAAWLSAHRLSGWAGAGKIRLQSIFRGSGTAVGASGALAHPETARAATISSGNLTFRRPLR
jgi:hypothetical protein